MRRVLTTLALLTALPAPASAAMMRHHDLASLAYQSEAVVVAERSGTGDSHHYRVLRSLHGPLARGQRLTLADGHFITSPRGRGIFSPPPEGALGDRVVVFLTRYEGRWRIVADGLRVTYGGRVYRFEQHMNPGPYVPVPQGRDPDDVRTGASGPPVDLDGLVRMTERAIRRAGAARRAIAGADRARIRALVPPHEAPVIRRWAPTLGFYTDAIARAALHRLAELGDVDGALTVLARTVGFASPHELRRLDPAAIRARAADASAPPEIRLAAVRWIFRPHPSREAATVAIGLLDDPAPRVRAVAAEALRDLAGTSGTDWPRRPAFVRGPLRQSLRRRWRDETDPLVRYALASLARAWEIRLRRPAWGFGFVRDGDTLRYGFASTDDRIDLDSVTVTAEAGDERRECQVEMRGGWSTIGERGGRARFQCPAGARDLRVVSRLRTGRRLRTSEQPIR